MTSTKLVDQVVADVLNPKQSQQLTRPDPVHEAVGSPAQLRRRDGSSVYDVAGSQLYTSAAVLADERFLVDTAHRRDGRAVSHGDVDLALLESVANGLNLNTAQAHLVRQMATSGARVQLAIAPAGSGKTTAMSALTAAWTHGVEGGTVLGLAPRRSPPGCCGKRPAPTPTPSPSSSGTSSTRTTRPCRSGPQAVRRQDPDHRRRGRDGRHRRPGRR